MLDSSLISTLADGILIVLLTATLIYVYRLHRRLSQLREERASFEKLIASFTQSTQQATLGLTAIRQTAESAAKDLQARIDQGQQVIAENRKATEDLKMLIGRAVTSADQLEERIGKARPIATPRNEPRPVAAPTPPSAPPQAPLGPEAAAVLSALSGIR